MLENCNNLSSTFGSNKVKITFIIDIFITLWLGSHIVSERAWVETIVKS